MGVAVAVRTDEELTTIVEQAFRFFQLKKCPSDAGARGTPTAPAHKMPMIQGDASVQATLKAVN
ncbi:hypothetical protein [Kamptonema formosum]|uniref:hypothetical protein n=1 Tax=Kamptonema formosum TaxID=331992 RepID=UPI00034D576D|nr:hypothetical protein [Oscillatoria sp. PCC 10802]